MIINLKRLFIILISTSLLIVVAVFGFGLQLHFSDSNRDMQVAQSEKPEQNVIGQYRPAFSLKDQSGELRNINEWDGKVLLLNFWATWCSPCKKEIPVFIALQKQYEEQGLQIIGVALDDEQSVKLYSNSIGINYPVMAADLAAAEISRRYGNRFTALPFSAFIGRNGKIVRIKAGELSRIETEKIILNLL